MEREPFDTPESNESEQPNKVERIAQIALQLAFEDLMQGVDDGKFTREEALRYMKSLTPLLIEEALSKFEDKP